MTATAQEVVRGAAVVIDDRIDEPEDAIRSILDQLTTAEVPTVRLRALPSDESLVHWKQFGLIVLDWELTYSTADDATAVPAGVSVPSGLADERDRRSIEFIRSLLEETALPVFVASNADLDGIRAALSEGLNDQAAILEDRVHVFSKSELEVSLFDTIGSWIDSRQALKALRAWKGAYIEAEIATFHQFSQAEEDWVVSVQRAAKADGAPLGVTLRDLIATNTLNRIGPLTIELPEASDDPLSDASALRRVLHLSAVIPDSALAPGEPGTGDLYVAAAAEEPYQEIYILLTPECELTARDERWRFTVLPAQRDLSNSAKQSPNRVAAVSKPNRGQLVSNLLTPVGDEYVIRLSAWESTWVEKPSTDSARSGPAGELWKDYKRIGRLIDPYVTHIQQHFAMVTIRKGLPNLPTDFYAGWSGA